MASHTKQTEGIRKNNSKKRVAKRNKTSKVEGRKSETKKVIKKLKASVKKAK